jgi:hypothetical protein
MIKDCLEFGSLGETVVIGPFISATTGKDPVTDLTIGLSDLFVFKSDSETPIENLPRPGDWFRHVGAGMYAFDLLGSYVDVLGKLDIIITKADVILPFRKTFEVRRKHDIELFVEPPESLSTMEISPSGSAFDGENVYMKFIMHPDWYRNGFTINGDQIDSFLDRNGEYCYKNLASKIRVDVAFYYNT